MHAHPKDADAFIDHYSGTHAPLGRKLPNLRPFEWIVSQTIDGTRPAHFVIATLHWDTREDALAALASPVGQAVVADLSNFATAGVDVEVGDVTIELQPRRPQRV